MKWRIAVNSRPAWAIGRHLVWNKTKGENKLCFHFIKSIYFGIPEHWWFNQSTPGICLFVYLFNVICFCLFDRVRDLECDVKDLSPFLMSLESHLFFGLSHFGYCHQLASCVPSPFITPSCHLSTAKKLQLVYYMVLELSDLGLNSENGGSAVWFTEGLLLFLCVLPWAKEVEQLSDMLLGFKLPHSSFYIPPPEAS